MEADDSHETLENKEVGKNQTQGRPKTSGAGKGNEDDDGDAVEEVLAQAALLRRRVPRRRHASPSALHRFPLHRADSTRSVTDE